jgi:predicted outer membrane repeat protein
MKNQYLFNCLFSVALCIASLISQAQFDYYVSPNGFGGAGTVSDPMDFQSALNLATSDNENSNIFLQEGVYSATPYIYIGDADSDEMDLLIRGGFNAEFTSIAFGATSELDGMSVNRCLDINANTNGLAYTVRLFGLTFQDGYVSGESGAGLRFQTANANDMQLNVYDSNFNNNVAAGNGSGGAIYANSNLSVYTSTFHENEAYNGGAVLAAKIEGNASATHVYVIDNSFVGNENYGNQGSTIWTNADFLMGECVVEGETDGSSSGNGSAIWGNTGAVLTVRASIFRDLSIEYWGSAIQAFDGDIYVSSSLFQHNNAGLNNGYGAISYFHNDGIMPRVVSVSNCTFLNNTSGTYDWASCIHFRGDNDDWCTITNSIFSSNGSNPVYAETGTGVISHSYIDAGYDGLNNGGSVISGEVGFVSPTSFQLTENSVCRNAGDNDAVEGVFDLNNGVRLLGEFVDLGSYEFNYAPSDINLTTSTLLENTGGMDYLVGLLNTVESETGDAFTYELTAGDGVNDVDNYLFYPTTEALYTNTTPDFESKPAYSIYLRTTDSYGQTYDKAFVITVIDVNEAPVVGNTIPDQEGEVAQAYAYEIPSDLFVDLDGGDVVTITALQENGDPLPAWLSFDGSTFTGTPPATQELSIKLTATDLGLLTAEVIFHLEIMPTEVSEREGWSLNVFPIPARDVVNVEVIGVSEKVKAKLVDAGGNVVQQVVLSKGFNAIDISELAAGVYTLQYNNTHSVNIVIH